MSTRLRWLIIALIAFAGMTYAVVGFGFFDYVQSWGGSLFKALSGACLGYGISRGVEALDISKQPVEQRPMAGLSRAILIGAGIIGVPSGM